MIIPFFDLTRQTISLQEELNFAYAKVLKKGSFIGGEEVLRFELNFAEYLGIAHCVTCGNGTDAIELVLEALGIGKDDEVIIPAFGWISGVHAIRRAGAIPIFVDVETNSGNIDVSQVEGVITSKTKAIMPTHLYGRPCDIVMLRKICDKHHLFLIEDCAQAHGAEVNKTKVGGFGDASIFSFYPTKNLGCFGDGGAVVTNHSEIADQVRKLKNYGKSLSEGFEMPGRNSRMDELQAAILNVKLAFLDSWNEQRKTIASIYRDHNPQMNFLDDSASVNYQVVLVLQDRDEFRKRLLDRGIETSIHYDFKLNDLGNYPIAEQLSLQVVSLPVFPELTTQEISYICEQLKQI